jgi:hypothetical protein
MGETLADAGRYIFRCARDAHAQITHLFDFVSPTTIALWNLRWQVQGFLSQVPDASSQDLSNRFASSSGMRGGELKRACVETPWEEQLAEFADFVLITLIAIFEDYIGRLVEGAPSKDRPKIAKALQFPGGAAAFPKANGRDWAFGHLNHASPSLAGVFAAQAKSNKRYAGNKIDNLLLCYRYFKELRNMIAHNGSRANERAELSYEKFQTVASIASLGVTEVLMHHPVVREDEIKLEFRGVTGLGDIILRIITTYDADLSETRMAEHELLARVLPVSKADQFLRARDARNRTRRIEGTIYESGMPRPILNPAFELLLKKNKIIPHFW